MYNFKTLILYPNFLSIHNIHFFTQFRLQMQDLRKFVSINSDVLELALEKLDVFVGWGGQGGGEAKGEHNEEFHFVWFGGALVLLEGGVKVLWW